MIDSNSIGDPTNFQPLDLLKNRLAILPPTPRDAGRVGGRFGEGDFPRDLLRVVNGQVVAAQAGLNYDRPVLALASRTPAAGSRIRP